MLTLFEQIDKGTLWRVAGGIHPPEFKTLSNQSNIAHLPLADQYIIPVPQVGESCTLAVAVGDMVTQGQPLTQGDSFRHLPVHAPVSGLIAAIETRPSNHASGLPVLCCIIDNDHQQRLCPAMHAPLSQDDVKAMSSDEILTRVKRAGVAGLGGAAFPTHIKLKPVSDIELLIINGVECEPYITSDDRLMREHSTEIVRGIEIIHQLLGPKRIVIAIEDNKPQAIEQMTDALNHSDLPAQCARVTAIPTVYPSGGEKQLIQIITGQEVPSGAIPANLGILVQNVGTAFSITQAVYCNAPLIERVVTLTGHNVGRPGNYWVPIGTPVDHLLRCTHFKGDSESPIIIGGPMMGYMLPNRHAPLLKGTNCILAPDNSEMAPSAPEMPCIRCGECAQACPAGLLPQQLFWHAKAEEYDKAASYNLRDCIECGCCSYVCPSDIPLVEYYRVAKSALRVEAEEKKQAELAKQRFDSRMLRLEQEKRAREEKAKQAAQKRKAAMSGTDKDAVAAAMARIKAKKAAETTTTAAPASNADRSATTSNTATQDKVAAAIARAKAKKAAQQASSAVPESSSNAPEPDEVHAPVVSQQDKIAAAIARAKAKKAAQQNPSSDEHQQVEPNDVDVSNAASSTPISETEAKKAKIAAAVAKAKAKKAAQQNPSSDEHQQVEPNDVDVSNAASSTPISEAEAKKAKIAAAVAKAKAKKAAQQNPSSDEHQQVESNDVDVSNATSSTPISEAEAKKAKIAAAVAKAKAKKAAQQAPSRNADIAAVPLEAPLVHADKISQQGKAVDSAELSAAEIKQQRIAAAVAKAKAKKLAKAASAAPDDELED
ncbi:electron transport complex subunit RsxC [Shewanella algidipiscicola]|uniref:electron transport complex subunit RsxC n=1 Tax=Shewanella algidipiscicola TaxID=614070 RepID=UPI000D78B652|nr:electron transport complex subunit RsxC [Shewanella algidipiscicola]